MSLPPYFFKHLMSIISSSKIATLFKFVSTVLFHRSSAILDFMEVTADYSFPDFRSPFPAPRFTNIPSHPYLGVQFDSKLCWKEHIEFLVRGAVFKERATTSVNNNPN